MNTFAARIRESLPRTAPAAATSSESAAAHQCRGAAPPLNARAEIDRRILLLPVAGRTDPCRLESASASRVSKALARCEGSNSFASAGDDPALVLRYYQISVAGET